MERNEPCWCGSGKKWKKCHFPEERAPSILSEQELRQLYQRKYGILIKNQEQIAGIRRAGHLAARILEALCSRAKEGTTTQQLDLYAAELHRDAGAIAAPLNYGHPPFPKSICTSINDVICHGIPDNRPLQNGDILNIDVSVILNGYFGDCSQMVMVGDVSEERRLVCDVSYHSLMGCVPLIKPGARLNQLGEFIQTYANSRGCSVVYQFVGHGVGLHFHEAPQVPHVRNALDIPLVPGMTFTIEPMINAGLPDAVTDPKDHWTARTVDGKASAQWEYQFLVTEDGAEILTPWKVIAG